MVGLSPVSVGSQQHTAYGRCEAVCWLENWRLLVLEALQNDLILFIVNVGINARFYVRVIHAVTFIYLRLSRFRELKVQSTNIKQQSNGFF